MLFRLHITALIQLTTWDNPEHLKILQNHWWWIPPGSIFQDCCFLYALQSYSYPQLPQCPAPDPIVALPNIGGEGARRGALPQYWGRGGCQHIPATHLTTHYLPNLPLALSSLCSIVHCRPVLYILIVWLYSDEDGRLQGDARGEGMPAHPSNLPYYQPASALSSLCSIKILFTADKFCIFWLTILYCIVLFSGENEWLQPSEFRLLPGD